MTPEEARASDRERLSEVLGGHLFTVPRVGVNVGCTCGWEIPWDRPLNEIYQLHAAHLADAVLDYLAERDQRAEDEALQEVSGVLPTASSPTLPARPEMTEKQKEGWGEAITRLHGYYDSLPTDAGSWDVVYHPEARRGRGHAITATYVDGDVLAQILMDVHGYPNVSIASLEWEHADSNEECSCDPCTQYRKEWT